MEYIAQIFTGGWNQPLYETKQILNRLEHIMKKIRLKGVIIGWNLNPELYCSVKKFLQGSGVKLYLWLPAFSEIGELGKAEEAMNLFGTTGDYKLQEGESFRFYCPGSEQNLKLLTDVYDRYFAGCGFDGVFLDKVRSQSFVTGGEDVFGCCCSRCRQELKARGADCDGLKEFIRETGIPEALRIRSLTPRGITFLHGSVETFFEAKKQNYTRHIRRLIGEFRTRGLQVGLDLYAPVLCTLVGQDYDALCSAADFVKPMMYRRTEAPAGIGFEMQAFADAVSGNHETAEILSSFPVTGEKFLREQLNAIPENLKEKTCPGLEINYRESIAETDPGYIEDSLKIFESCGIHTSVLAWDMMLAPESHLRAAARRQRT